MLSLARLAPEKRLPDLLHAFAVVRLQRPDATLTLAGTGPLEGELRTLVADLGLSDAVAFPGYVDAHRALAEHDVLVLLSVWENCSYALLDAVTAGLGVVASCVGGNPEILPARCLVDAGDPASVADAIIDQASVDNRPLLPACWPTTAEMAAHIAELYEGALR